MNVAVPIASTRSRSPKPKPAASTLWQRIAHPCLWFGSGDLPRLRHNAKLPFWKPKFDAWRQKLRGKSRLGITTPVIDFHVGTNEEALQAALCYVVDEDAHFGRLVGTFLEEIVGYYLRSPDWRARMCSHEPGEWTGNQWDGLSNNHIIDPQLWLSCAHLYDVIYGKNFMSPEIAATFEEMMALFHQVACLHEENLKLDNNRAVWLTAGSYVSTLFDKDLIRAELCMNRLRSNMFRFLDTILDDGIHYEIGPYAWGTLAAMQVFARFIRGVEQTDFFHAEGPENKFHTAYRAFVGLIIPGSSLRLPLMKDRVNHWDSICAGYLEYGDPELGWLVSRMEERSWVPMFRHWPQGFEFYTYQEPTRISPPKFLHSLFPQAGMGVLRTGWEPTASSVYFRYGYQGSSHGGGLDKLHFELTCNDEPLLTDGLISEQSHHKNVVLVDGHNQQQCSGKLLFSSLNEKEPIQALSAMGGLGEIPSQPIFHDPRIEANYWCTRFPECFPGVARMRRTLILIEKRFWLMRDTLWSLDGKEHDYQWLFQTFARVNGMGTACGPETLVFHPKQRNRAEKIRPESRTMDRFTFAQPGRLQLRAAKASLSMAFASHGTMLPDIFGLSSPGLGRYAYNGSPETGDGLSEKALTTLHLILRGRNVVLTTLLAATPGSESLPAAIESIVEENLDRALVTVNVDGRRQPISIIESAADDLASISLKNHFK